MTNQTVSDLFDRHGDPAPADATIKLDGKQPYYIRRDKCQRCGGSGIYSQFHGTCYRCAGRGIVDHLDIHTVKLYTREQLVKLDAAKAKAAAKKAAKAEAAALVTAAAFDAANAALVASIPAEWLDGTSAFWSQFHSYQSSTLEPAGAGLGYLNDTRPQAPDCIVILRDIVRKGRHFGSISEKQAAFAANLVVTGQARLQALAEREATRQAQAATSQFVGTISQKLAVAVTCTKVATFERDSFGYRGGRETVNVCTFVDAAGNILVTKTPAFRAEVGEAGILTGQVKQHDVYQDVKQTQLIRTKLEVA